MLSSFTVRRIESVAQRLRAKYDASDPYELATRMGIMVEFAEYPELMGFCCRVLGNTVIALNTKVGCDERKCVCAHELGHIVLGHLKSEGFTAMHYCELSNLEYWFESEANCFAAALLLDDDEVMEAVQCYQTQERIAAALRVCPELLRSKMAMMTVKGRRVTIPEATYRAWRRGG